METNEKNAQMLKQILDLYCDSSGQLISDAKSNIYFSPNTPVEERVVLCQILNIVNESLTAKCLSLPVIVGADRSDYFQHLIEKVLAKINGWKKKLLSIGGKEVLLKAIAQAMPVFAMTLFKIPKSICKGITDAIS
jgi:hypothetical protein